MNPRAPQPLRVAACEVARRIAEAGYEALFAGGCVRDEILGVEPKDYDIATNATPDDIRRIFPKARDVGEAFGVMLVRSGDHVFEVATFRKDGPYDDRRRPNHIEFSSPKDDAARRDFTINGIFLRPETGEIVDYFDGRGDIGRRLVRAIGDPHARIAEDRLRMLRAARFAARLGFELEAATADAVRAHAAEIGGVSRERVGDELRRMLGHPARARAAAIVEDLRLDHAVFGKSLGAPLAGHPRIAGLSDAAPWTTALAAWALDRSAGGSTVVVPVAVEPLVAGLRERLILSNRESDEVVAVLAARAAIAEEFDAAGIARRTRLAALPGFDEALAVLAAERPEDARRWRDEADRLLPTRRLPAPLIDGNGLIGIGIRPGPVFKNLLDRLLDAQIEGRVRTTDDAANLARELASAPRQGG